MLDSINQKFNQEKSDRKNNKFIVESVVSDDDVVTDEVEAAVDDESVPDHVYNKLDKELDKIVDGMSEDDDVEIEDLIDDDDDDIDDEDEDTQIQKYFTDPEANALINAALSEATTAWQDDESIGHPDVNRRSGNIHQPKFAPSEEHGF